MSAKKLDADVRLSCAPQSPLTPRPLGSVSSAPRGRGLVAAEDANSGAYMDMFGTNAALRAQAEQTSVSCLMSRGVVCLSPDASIQQVSQMLLERNIGSAPVVDVNWRPVGMVSKTDLLRVYVEAAAARLDCGIQQGRSADPPVAPRTVEDITQPFVLSLHEESPVSVAAALMAYEGVHRLPIVASSGEVVGMVSTLDIVRWVARYTSDEEVPEEL